MSSWHLAFFIKLNSYASLEKWRWMNYKWWAWKFEELLKINIASSKKCFIRIATNYLESSQEHDSCLHQKKSKDELSLLEMKKHCKLSNTNNLYIIKEINFMKKLSHSSVRCSVARSAIEGGFSDTWKTNWRVRKLVVDWWSSGRRFGQMISHMFDRWDKADVAKV